MPGCHAGERAGLHGGNWTTQTVREATTTSLNNRGTDLSTRPGQPSAKRTTESCEA